MGGWVGGGMGGGRGQGRSIDLALLRSKKKKRKFTLSFTSGKRFFFYIYDVIVKQNLKNKIKKTLDYSLLTLTKAELGLRVYALCFKPCSCAAGFRV